MEERLQKYMARCGVDSRRKCEELIAQGLVAVNGEIVREPGVRIDPVRDRVTVGGKRLNLEKPAHYAHYKVKGVTTTVSDDLGRRTVMDCLPDIRERVYPVGRLDKESEGLLLLTNDGELANYLTHPAHGVEKTYRVVAEGRIAQEVLAALAEKGMRLGPVLVKPSRVELVRYDNDNTIVLISVSEGINREVRRIFAALGHEVKRLLRTQVGPIGLIGMKRGATRPLTPRELAQLRKGMAGMEPEEEAAAFPPGSAKGRKPKGPRGRPRNAKAARRGKPDPAKAKAGTRPPAKRDKRDKGSVVEDDWRKRGAASGRGRRATQPKAETPEVKISLKTKTLRPAKKTTAAGKPAGSRGGAMSAKPPRKGSGPAKPRAGAPTKPSRKGSGPARPPHAATPSHPLKSARRGGKSDG